MRITAQAWTGLGVIWRPVLWVPGGCGEAPAHLALLCQGACGVGDTAQSDPPRALIPPTPTHADGGTPGLLPTVAREPTERGHRCLGGQGAAAVT